MLFSRETSKSESESSWFALFSNSLGKEAVEGKDGYTILTFPAPAATGPPTALSSDGAEDTNGTIQDRKSRGFICWDFVGASVI